MSASERWFRLLLRLYPTDFREELGESLVETYVDRSRAEFTPMVWARALWDSVRNGLGERMRPSVAWRRGGNWGRDGELALRRLVRAPLFTVAMLGTLTIGLGAFAVVWAVVDNVLLEPLPYEEPDDLYFVWRDYTWVGFERGWVGGTDVAALQEAGGVIEDAVGLRLEAQTLTDRASDEPREIVVLETSPGLFELLGVEPALGRGFAAEEVGPDRPPVVVLGHDLWVTLGADRSVVGTTMRLDGEAYTVIGVMGPDFRFVRHNSLGPPDAADAYAPFDYDLAGTNPGNGAFAGLIRARRGSSPEVVASAVGAVGSMIDERDFGSKGLELQVTALREDLVAPIRPAVIVLGAAGGFLVLVLTANLATLLLARAAQREQEFAVSRALGANGLALVRATLLEAGILGSAGGAGGALVAVWGTRALVALAPLDLPRRDAIAADWRVALVVVLAGAIVGLLAGALPALWATRSRLATLMGNAAVRGGGGAGRLRRGMVVVQVALSLVLLTGGALVVRSFERLLRADPGFDPAGVLTLRVPVPDARYPDDAGATALHERLRAELGAIPGVIVAGAASALPLTTDADQTAATFPGSPGITGDQDRDNPLVDYIGTRPGYFEALGMRVLAGRGFGASPQPGLRETVIDRALARQFFPSGNPVGALLVLGGDSMRVIGVVEHARLYDIHQDGRSQVYIRSDDTGYRSLYFALRSERPPLELAAAARAAVRRVDDQLAVADVRPMREIVQDSLREPRLTAVLLAAFSAGALLLAAMGLAGVVSGSVTRRRHELAVRLALGADATGVRRLVIRDGAALVALGLVLGLPGVFAAGRLVSGVLIGVSPYDVPTLAAVAAGLALVALVACWLPARRVTRIDPARSLRQS